MSIEEYSDVELMEYKIHEEDETEWEKAYIKYYTKMSNKKQNQRDIVSILNSDITS